MIIKTMKNVNADVEDELNRIANKNKQMLNSAMIVPLSPQWKFSTNGLYLLLATAGCGKSRFIIKHILMSEQLFPEPYYNQICYCSTSGELDKTVSMYINEKVIKTPLIEVSDRELMSFLAKHLKRKKKFYSMVQYIQSGYKIINKTLEHSIDKHHFKVMIRCKKKKVPPEQYDMYPVYSQVCVVDNEIDIGCIEKINKPRLLSWIIQKFRKYNVTGPVWNLLVVLDDFAGHQLIERKETPLAKMMTKCRHYNTTFIIAVQTSKYVIKNIKRQATDIVLWAGVSEEDFIDLMKEIQYSYDRDLLWAQYRALTNQKDYLILNIKAQSYEFVPFNGNMPILPPVNGMDEFREQNR